MTETHDLAALRERIDAVDEQLHALLNERARLAQRAGVSKLPGDASPPADAAAPPGAAAGRRTVDFYRPEREAQVLRSALERNHGPLRNEEIVRLFREIMSACLAQEEPLKVAFLG
ncbi:MAG: chorismate mutase, partial [Steroidobacteraceae bacterium]